MTPPLSYHEITSGRDYRLYRADLIRKYGFNTKPSVVEARALRLAAICAVRAERSALEGASPDMVVKNVAAHRRALDTLELLAEARRKRKGKVPYGTLIVPDNWALA
jgi:hypothetical protein